LTYQTILTDIKWHVGIITLNRPDKLNALSTTLFREFEEALTAFERDDDVRVLLVTGAGEKAFSAGADIHEMVASQESGKPLRRVSDSDWPRHLAFYKKPTIGVINGLAHGGGALMSSVFDMRFGCERTSFRFLAVTYGRINSAWSLPLIVGLPMAKELLLTGRVVGAEEAFRIGLLNRLVSSSRLMEAAMETAELIARNDPGTVQVMRRILNSSIGLDLQGRLDNEAELTRQFLKPPLPTESFKDFLKRNPPPDKEKEKA
jgi:enoyl-CoA hydratase